MNDNDPPTDVQRVENADLVRRTIAELEAIGRAKQAASRGLKPRTPVRLDPDQLAEAYRRAGIRNPRQRFRPTVAAGD